jgi:hypothetical protein
MARMPRTNRIACYVWKSGAAACHVLYNYESALRRNDDLSLDFDGNGVTQALEAHPYPLLVSKRCTFGQATAKQT